jgi:hypothetical protein
MTFEVKQYSRFLEEKHNHRIFAFCVFISGASADLEMISEVEYTLHPSFPDPRRVSTDRRHCFVLQSQAYGGFGMLVRIFSGNECIHEEWYVVYLRDGNWPMGEKASKFESKLEFVIYSSLIEEEWDWRKLSTLVRRAGVGVDEVVRTLHLLEERGLVRKAYFKSVDKDELWGATCRVGCLPECLSS